MRVCTTWHKRQPFLFSHLPSRLSWFAVHLVGSSYLLQFSISLSFHLFFPTHNLLLSCTVCYAICINFANLTKVSRKKIPQPSNLPLIPLHMFAKTKKILAMSLNHSAQRRRAGVALWSEHCICGEKAQGAKDLV